MPVVVETDPAKLAELYGQLPSGSHALDSTAKAMEWLDHRTEEYVVVLGPNLPLAEALSIADRVRTTRPATSPVLIRNHVDTEVLTQAMQAGVRDVVTDSDAHSLAGALERAYQLWSTLRGAEGGVPQQGKVITVFSPKGGVGKTAVSVNLALALSEGGVHRVCIADLDLAFGDVAITLQLFPTHSIEHAVGAEQNMDYKFLESLLTLHEDGLRVLAAPNLPDARDRISGTLLTGVVAALREHFDYVVIDTAPAFDEATLSALDATDECVVVATLDVPTLKNVKVALETMDMLGAAVGHRHLVLNRANDQVGIGPEKVESILGMPIATHLETSMDVSAATNAGRPIVISQPRHPVSSAMRELAGILSARPEGPSGTHRGVEADVDSEPRSGRRFRVRR